MDPACSSQEGVGLLFALERHERINYRVLYFFSGQNLAVLSAGLVKKDVVPEPDIKRAIDRKRQFMIAPEFHSFLGSERYV
jgi:hypothetical protein